MQLWTQARSVLLGALAGWGAGLVLRALLGYSGAFVPGLTALLAVAALLGTAAVPRQTVGRCVLLAGCIVLGAWWGCRLTDSIWGGIYTMAAALLVFMAVLSGGWGFYAPLGPVTVIVLVLGLLTGYMQLVTVFCAGAALVLTLDGFRARSLRKGQLQSQIDRTGPGPEGMEDHSLLLMALFLLGAIAAAAVLYGLGLLLIRGILALGRRLSGGAAAVYGAVAEKLEQFRQWFLGLFTYPPETDGTPDPPAGDGAPLPGAVAVVSTMFLVMVVVSGITILAGCGTILYLRSRRPRKRKTRTALDYEDEIEALERPRRRPIRERRRAHRARHEGVLYVRYAFQQMLKRRCRQDPMVRSSTPNELRRDIPVEEDLIDAYNRVRYRASPATEEDLAAAKAYLNAK